MKPATPATTMAPTALVPMTWELSYISMPRRWLVGVKLGEKGIEHFFRRKALVGARKIGAIAPVLIRPEEKNFDTELSRLFGDCEHICLVDRPRVDSLATLDSGKRGDAVA